MISAAGVAAAVRFDSPGIALATTVWYGGVFAVLSWFRPSFALLALVAVAPLITVELGLGPAQKSISADKVALLAVAGVWILRRGRTAAGELVRLPVIRCWAVFLAVVLMSAVRSGFTVDQGWGVVKQAIYAGLFLATMDVLRAERTLPLRIVTLGGLTGGVVALVGLVERLLWISGHWVPLYFKHGTQADPFTTNIEVHIRHDVPGMMAVIERVVPRGGSAILGSTIGHVNFLTGYLVLVAPILVALAFVAKGKLRAAAIAGALVTAVVLVYSNSVGAWVGLASGISLASLLLPRTAVSPRARVGLLVTCMGLATVAGGLGVAKFAAEWNSISVRVAAHRIGFAAIAERPLLGFGEGGYARESRRLEQRVFGGLLKSYHQSTEGLSAHSSFLQTAVERGLLGLGAFAALLASVLIAGIRGVGRAPDPARRLLLLGLLAGLVSFAVQAFTENLFDYSKVAAIFWIMGAALVHLSGPHSSPD